MQNPNKEDIDRAFEAHIVDFQACREEIKLNISMQNQMMNYAVAIIAGVATLLFVSLPSANVQSQSSSKVQPQIILLVGSLLLSAISWALVEAGLAISHLSSYIEHSLAPKIQELIGHKESAEFVVLGWEKYATSYSVAIYTWRVFAFGKHAIAYLPSVAFVLAFYFQKSSGFDTWDSIERILFVAAIIAIAVVPLGSLVRLFFRKSNRSKKTNQARSKGKQRQS